MIKLVIGNSISKIEGLTVAQFKAIRDVLSYTEQTRGFRKGFRQVKRYLIDRRGNFPTGLRHLAQKFLHEKRLQVQVVDSRVRPEKKHGMFELNLPPYVSPYPEQWEAVNRLVFDERGTVSMPTGTGKSLTQALLIYAMQMKTLVVVPNLGLKEQLQSTFKAIFGSLKNITVENIDSPRLKDAKDYDLLIVDEAHHSAAKTYRDLNKTAWQKIYHRAFFTATPFRSRDAETILMECLTGEVVYRLNYATAVEKKFICPIEVYYYDLPQQKMKGNSKSWPAVYSELIVKNDVRNRLIAHLLKTLHSQLQSTLCLVKEIAHGEALSEFTGAAFAHGEAEDCRQLIDWFANGNLTALIGTTGVVGEGVDSRAAEWIILAAGGKSRNQLLQNIGRGVRRFGDKESAKIILFRDRSNKFLLDHFNAQVKAIRDEYAVEPIPLDLPEGM
jgi:superfamily II DNA or RNA helicase